MDPGDLINRFAYHRPASQAVADLHQKIRTLHLELAQQVNLRVPDGREKSIVMTKLEESMMWCNAAIARHVSAPLLGADATEQSPSPSGSSRA